MSPNDAVIDRIEDGQFFAEICKVFSPNATPSTRHEVRVWNALPQTEPVLVFIACPVTYLGAVSIAHHFLTGLNSGVPAIPMCLGMA